MKNYWDSVTKEKWDNLFHIYRPSKVDIANLEQIGKNKSVILFGATPEIREFFSKRNQELTVFDFSEKFVTEMGKYVNDKTRETYVYDNWLTYKSKIKFDYILGDFILNVIKKEDHEQLKNCIKQMSHEKTKVIFRTLSKKDAIRAYISSGNINMLLLAVSCTKNTVNIPMFEFLSKLFFAKKIETRIVYLS